MAEPKSRESQGITPGNVLDAASRIVETEGVEALTMRRIAGDLEVAPPTIYWHVGNKEELLSNLLERMERELSEVSATGSTPHQRIKSVIVGVRHQIAQFPALSAVAAATGKIPHLYVQSQQILIYELQQAGLPAERVGFALHNLLTFNACFFLFDTFVLPEGASTYHYSGPDAVVSQDALDPAVAEAVSADADLPKIYEFQLDNLIAGLLTESG
ncbi:MAG: TetR/AcrR family transcriptional regulator [Acidobacteria bacterium]|nr:TetR/AcrR family transcriptional regulator [Acidobacteriota bacterium]